MFIFHLRRLDRALLALIAYVVSIQGPVVAQGKSLGALPDACRLLPRGDLEALYPGRKIAQRGPLLSSIFRGPQYTESCQYVIRLPSATSNGDLAHFVSLSIVRFADVPSRGDAARSFVDLFELRQAFSRDPKIGLTVEFIPEIGYEAFAEVRKGGTTVTVRQQDLIFAVDVGGHSQSAIGDASAMARQAASRWREDVGMVEREQPIARNDDVVIAVDVSAPAVAEVQDWSDACTLLTRADISRTFPDAEIKNSRQVMGELRYDGREHRIARLPNPIACQYDLRRVVSQDGTSVSFNHQVQISLKNVAATLQLSQEFFNNLSVRGAIMPVDRLGDEANIDRFGRVTTRKGRFTIEVRVTGGDRNGALHVQATDRAIAMAKMAAGRLP